MNEIIIALALLSAPPPQADAEGVWPKDNPAENLLIKWYAPLIREFAFRDELMDPREGRYLLSPTITTTTKIEMILGFSGNIRNNLTTLQWRQQDLYMAPSVADSQRFPTRSDAGEVLAFNRAFKNHLDAMISPAWDWQGEHKARALKENEKLYQVWDTIRDTRCEYYYCWVRRQALKRLRDDLLGPEAYYTRELPPPIPLWFFQEVK